MRRRFAWLLALPLAVIGTLAGHSVGYRAALPEAHERAQVLTASGHGYLAYAPIVISICTALAVLGFVATVLGATRGHEPLGERRRVALVAALSPLAFVLQEFLERYVHDGHVQWGFATSAPFLLGLATQVPFALLAAAIAFALATAAERVASAFRVASRPRPRLTALRFTSFGSVDLPCEPVLARGYAGRGPPLPV